MSSSEQPGPKRRVGLVLRDGAADAIRFFTRIPLPAAWAAPSSRALFDGVAAAAPLAGALVGAVSAAALGLGQGVGLPPLASAVLAIAAAVAVSGALHDDGLADVADGFGGGATREAKLAIMRDSRLGTYGVCALVLALAMRIALVAALADRLDATNAALALVGAAALARPLALAPLRLLPPARADGVGRAAIPGLRALAIGAGLGAATMVATAGALPGLGAVAVALLAVAAVCGLARRQIGGVTGDVCGATAALAEIAALGALAAAAA
jgi:adenosylcobinamide-GDP ribazoletransferase